MRWFPLTELPDEMIPYPDAGILGYRDGIPSACSAGPPHTTTHPLTDPALDTDDRSRNFRLDE